MITRETKRQGDLKRMTEQQFKRYIVATFLDDTTCEMLYTYSLCESTKALLANQIVLIPMLIHCVDGKVMAFNQSLTVAWKEKVDGIVFIDKNSTWNPQALFDVISSDKDCVALPVSKPNGFNIQLGEISRLQRDKNTGEIKVPLASMDFMYLSSYTINEMCITHQSIDYNGQDVKMVLQTGDIFTGYYNESQILNSRLSDINIETWVNPNHSIMTTHKQPIQSDFASLLSDLEKKG